MTENNCKVQEKPIYLAVSEEVPQKGRKLRLDKIIEQHDPVYWWGWDGTNVGRVSYVKPISHNIYRATTKEAALVARK